MPIDLSPYRKEIQVAGTAPVRLSVVDIGPLEGPGRGTVVCIHGCAGNADQWGPQIAHLARDHRVIAPDLRGHGLSEVVQSSYSLEEFLWDITQLLTQLSVDEPFIMLAHSFGGPVAITFAASQPQRVSRLVLIATGPAMHINPLHEFIVKLPVSLGALERLRPVVMPKTYAPVFVIQKILAGTLFRWDGYKVLPRVTTPTLLIAGQWDFIATASQAEESRRLMPNARLEVVRYTRHLPHLERPDAVNRLLDRFLRGPRSWRGEGGG
ncbi:alpha/beta fold hydrolase [Oscillochloris sp. ZM17-4]|uniref:alpha/beta fold hydrolase n=1 Tax=Oscillochloris sp. ZM17-4 TaxID=2866714 RepID=UPI001C730C81|nr:alpha/beta fold hydrolase [Oscillochloris sp. ZM17-4]MBX0328164.1 alpha/beta fold hydrolase [Oscillochloris sp. ZM17-4]